MADIVASLFGVTPESYQQAQAQRATEFAMQYANMAPLERASFGLARSGYQLANALAGALGAEDPQLRMISARNAIARQINWNDPASIQQGVQQLAQANDTVGAMQLATVARDLEYKQAQTAQALAAAKRERQQAVPGDILKAQRIGEITVQLQDPSLTPQDRANLEAQLAALNQSKTTAQASQIQLASDIEATQAAIDQLTAQPPGPERDAALRRAQVRMAALERQLPKEARDERFGIEREAVSMEVYNKPFSQLTQAERAAVNKRVEEEQNRKAKSSAAVFPGQKELVDIPEWRKKVQATIDPQLKAINAADQAITAIDDSLATNNFVSFNAARVQLAKALGDSQLSRRDVEQAGGDPSLTGRLYDATSTLFTSTPSADTQQKIKRTLEAIRKVAARKATAEIDVQRRIALRSPGYTPEAVTEALTFPELAAPAPAATGAKPIYARNPRTNERIMSTDGGVTWAPAPAAR